MSTRPALTSVDTRVGGALPDFGGGLFGRFVVGGRKLGHERVDRGRAVDQQCARAGAGRAGTASASAAISERVRVRVSRTGKAPFRRVRRQSRWGVARKREQDVFRRRRNCEPGRAGQLLSTR